MEIYIITHSRSNPYKAFLSKSAAYALYKELCKDKEPCGSYGVVSLEIEDEEVLDER